MRLLVTLSAVFTASVLAAPQKSKLPRATCDSDSFRYLGRVNPATGELTWSSTGVEFTFTGTSASLPLASVTGSNKVEIIVDGGAPTIIENPTVSAISVPGKLASGSHNVIIRKLSEATFGSVFIKAPTTSGTFEKVAMPKKRIEIIGDSITCAYGIDGTFPCTSTASVEDSSISYAALTAKNLSMDYSIVAWSGKGVTRNYVTDSAPTSPIMPQLWSRYGANDADNSYDFKTPVDIVVINLGTNDFSFLGYDSSGKSYNARPLLDATTYQNAMVNFTKVVQSKYPKAEFFVTSSPMLSDSTSEMQHTKQETALKAAVAQLGSKTHFVSIPAQDESNNNIGCDYHPSKSTHEQMAVLLTNAIKSVLG